MSDTQFSCWRWIRKGETQPNGGSWWGAGARLDPCKEDWRTERKNHCLAGLTSDWRCRYLETEYSVSGDWQEASMEKKSVTNTTWGEDVLLLGFFQEGGILTEYFRFQDSSDHWQLVNILRTLRFFTHLSHNEKSVRKTLPNKKCTTAFRKSHGAHSGKRPAWILILNSS